MANEQDRAALSRLRGQAAAQIPDSALRAAFIAQQGDAEGKSAGPNWSLFGGPNLKPVPDATYQQLQKQAQDALATNGQSVMVRPTGFAGIGR